MVWFWFCMFRSSSLRISDIAVVSCITIVTDVYHCTSSCVKLGEKPPKNIINCNTWEKVTKKKSGKNSGRKKLKTTESFGTLDMRTSGCIILANEEIFESHSWINVLKFDYSFFFLNFARIDSIHQEYSFRHFNTPKKVMYTNSDGCKPCVHHRKISTLTP